MAKTNGSSARTTRAKKGAAPAEAPVRLAVVPAPVKLRTGSVKVAEYADQLRLEAQSQKVRGIVVFEDRGDSMQIVEVGSCTPIPPRMLMGLARFVNRELLGI